MKITDNTQGPGVVEGLPPFLPLYEADAAPAIEELDAGFVVWTRPLRHYDPPASQDIGGRNFVRNREDLLMLVSAGAQGFAFGLAGGAAFAGSVRGALFLIGMVLSDIDTMVTMYFVERKGPYVERNPLMRLLLEEGDQLFLPLKVMGSLAAFGILALCPTLHALKALKLCVGIYFGLDVNHLIQHIAFG